MARGGPFVTAAADVGATSVHLIVGETSDDGLRLLADESAFLELGSAVSNRGSLGAAPRTRLVEALTGFAATARAAGAADMVFVGTEPLRRAADSFTVVHEVGRETNVPLHVLTHDEEGLLTILGVIGVRTIRGDALIVDIGGGSSELSFVSPGRDPRMIGLRLGSAALVGRYVEHDPPTRPEFDAMRRAAGEALGAVPGAHAGEVIAVGGTASNLGKLASGGQGLHLTAAAVDAAIERLLSAPAATIAERHGVNPVRAKVLSGGAAILEATMDRFGVNAIEVCDAGLREGVVLALARAGIGWRDRLPALVRDGLSRAGVREA